MCAASTALGQALTGVAITSNAGDDGTYIIDDLVEVTATFDADVTVTGNPVVRVMIGAEERRAVYWSGQGTALLFRYGVVAGDLDEDGISIGANRLDLSGGMINGEDGTAASITHDATENQPSHKVDGIAPTVLGVGIVSDPGADETYSTGDVVEFGALFDEPMAVSGSPTLAVLVGDRVRSAAFVRTEGNVVVFAYGVRAEDQDEDGISIEMNALSAGGGTISDIGGNPADLMHEALEAEASHKVAGVNLPITGIQFVSDAGEQDTYTVGDTVGVGVVFSSPVTVTGRPTLRLEIGDSGRIATFQTALGGGLLFAYTVVEGDLDEDGISIEQNALALSGGAIVDAAGSPVDVRHSAVGDQTRHKVDAVSPTVEGVMIVSDAGEDGSYRPGEVIEAAVQFTEPVLVDGSPRLYLRVGATLRSAGFVAVDDGALRFEYTLDADDHDEDGIGIDANALSASGALIRDRVGNPALVAHAALPDQGDHKVDGVVPAVASVALASDPGADDTYGVGDVVLVTVTFAEAVDVAGMPTIALRIGNVVRQAGYVGGSGDAALRFEYTVVEGDVDTDGLSVPPDTLALNAGQIADAAGNPATLSHAGVADDPAHKVFTALPSAVAMPADLSLVAGGQAETVSLAPLFEGAGIAFSASSANAWVATADVADSVLTVVPLREGAAAIEISATNFAGTATASFAVTVTTDETEKAVLAEALAGIGRSMLSGTADVFDGRFAMARGGARRASASARYDTATPSGAGLHGLDVGPSWTSTAPRQPRGGLPVGSVFNLDFGNGAGWTLWGARFARGFEGDADSGGFDGDGSGTFLGLERRGGNWMAGLSVAGNRTEVAYDFAGVVTGAGELMADVYGIYPYFHWGRGGELQVWFVGGFGLGELDGVRSHLGEGSDGADLGMSMGLAGARYRLPWRLLGGSLSARGDAGVMNLSAEDGAGALNDLVAGVSTFRGGVEAAWHVIGLEPFGEVSARFDGGDGQTGMGIEMAGGVRLLERVAGIGLEAKGRVLALHTASGFSESGFSLIASVAPGARGQGFQLRVAPRWGAPTESMDAFRQGGRPFDRPDRPDRPGRWGDRQTWGVDASVGYGLAQAGGTGVLTPFGEVNSTGTGERRLRLGVRYDVRQGTSPLRLEMSGEQVRYEQRFEGREARFVLTARGTL